MLYVLEVRFSKTWEKKFLITGAVNEGGTVNKRGMFWVLNVLCEWFQGNWTVKSDTNLH